MPKNNYGAIVIIIIYISFLSGNNKYQRKGDFQDSFSDENSDDDTTNFEFEDTCDGSQASSQGRTATTAPSIISSNLGNNFVVSHLGWFTLDKCFDTHN